MTNRRIRTGMNSISCSSAPGMMALFHGMLFLRQAKTKAVYMSEMIAKLAVQFCKERDFTRLEVMEVALVEYLIK